MNQYLVKQVLDLGVYGVMFPMINSREEALNAIASMRYPKAAGETDAGPQGVRAERRATPSGIGGLLMVNISQRLTFGRLIPRENS